MSERMSTDMSTQTGLNAGLNGCLGHMSLHMSKRMPDLCLDTPSKPRYDVHGDPELADDLPIVAALYNTTFTTIVTAAGQDLKACV